MRVLISNIPEEADFGWIVESLHRAMPDIKIHQVPDEGC